MYSQDGIRRKKNKGRRLKTLIRKKKEKKFGGETEE
jgi:hypothetical protein